MGFPQSKSVDRHRRPSGLPLIVTHAPTPYKCCGRHAPRILFVPGNCIVRRVLFAPFIRDAPLGWGAQWRRRAIAFKDSGEQLMEQFYGYWHYAQSRRLASLGGNWQAWVLPANDVHRKPQNPHSSSTLAHTTKTCAWHGLAATPIGQAAGM